MKGIIFIEGVTKEKQIAYGKEALIINKNTKAKFSFHIRTIWYILNVK